MLDVPPGQFAGLMAFGQHPGRFGQTSQIAQFGEQGKAMPLPPRSKSPPRAGRTACGNIRPRGCREPPATAGRPPAPHRRQTPAEQYTSGSGPDHREAISSSLQPGGRLTVVWSSLPVFPMFWNRAANPSALIVCSAIFRSAHLHESRASNCQTDGGAAPITEKALPLRGGLPDQIAAEKG